MKKVLVTGGAGFIAHHLIRHLLLNTDWEVTSLDRLDYSGNLNRISDMMTEFDMYLENIGRWKKTSWSLIMVALMMFHSGFLSVP